MPTWKYVDTSTKGRRIDRPIERAPKFLRYEKRRSAQLRVHSLRTFPALAKDLP